MSNRTYVRIECRTASRAESSYGLKTDLRCRTCSGELSEVSHRWRIPKRGDEKGWQQLRQIVATENEYYQKHHRRNALEQLNKIDRLIQSVSNQKASDTKEAKLKRLRSDRRRLFREYRGLLDDYEHTNSEQAGADQTTAAVDLKSE